MESVSPSDPQRQDGTERRAHLFEDLVVLTAQTLLHLAASRLLRLPQPAPPLREQRERRDATLLLQQRRAQIDVRAGSGLNGDGPYVTSLKHAINCTGASRILVDLVALTDLETSQLLRQEVEHVAERLSLELRQRRVHQRLLSARDEGLERLHTRTHTHTHAPAHTDMCAKPRTSLGT